MKNVKLMAKTNRWLFHCGVDHTRHRLCGVSSINNLDGNLVEISKIRLPSIQEPARQ